MIKITSSSEYSHVVGNINLRLHEVSSSVREIISSVKELGDEALRKYAMEFDGVKLESIELSEEEKETALRSVSEDYIDMISRAAVNISEFHKRQLNEGYMYIPCPGVIMGQRVLPIERVGIYIPGGLAAYPSSVLMNAIPAKVAGVRDIFMSTPNPTPEIIACAKLSGVSRIFRIGGAQAIAAFAYGTETVPKADKITGPGNIYVTEAKRQLYGVVGLDMIAGPSEIVIIADKNNFPAHIAADMLAQSEHDPDARAILITPSRRIAQAVSSEIEVQIAKLARKDIARKSIDNNGAIIIAKNIYEAVSIADMIAPEHLEICADNPFSLMTHIHNAGSIFLGRHSPQVLGDYYAGVNHTLPTMGTARYSSPLSVDDFVHKSQYVCYTEEALMNAADDIEMFAGSEGLDAHARSISIRRE